MPKYDYVCVDCGEIQEVSHSMCCRQVVICLCCGGNCKINIGSNISLVQFKGGGWPGEDMKKGKYK